MNLVTTVPLFSKGVKWKIHVLIRTVVMMEAPMTPVSYILNEYIILGYVTKIIY